MEEAQADFRSASPSPPRSLTPRPGFEPEPWPAASPWRGTVFFPSSSKKLPPTYHFRNLAIEIDDLRPPTFLPFQLQFDKPMGSQVKIAEWNPEKDLLTMVTEDSKILLHRFN